MKSRLLHILFIVPAMACLITAMWGGLLRLTWDLPIPQVNWFSFHGPLMVAGFLGTLIGVERAAAAKRWWSYGAPLLFAAGGIHLAAGGLGPVPRWLIVSGSAIMVLNYAVSLLRFRDKPTVIMSIGALALLIGLFRWAQGDPISGLFGYWALFLILTIAGERLELSRFLAPPEKAVKTFLWVLLVLTVCLLDLRPENALGFVLGGSALILTAAWLFRYDMARVNIRNTGLNRFLGVALLAGYGWLVVGGTLLIFERELVSGYRYDAILHSVFLGFAMSMIFGHGPVIFPGLLKVKLPFSKRFYSHLIVLHLGLLVRVGGDLLEVFPLRQWGGAFNVAAVLLFLLNTVTSIRFEKS